MVENRSGDGRTSERPEGHDCERHPDTPPDISDVAHLHRGLAHERHKHARESAVENVKSFSYWWWQG